MPNQKQEKATCRTEPIRHCLSFLRSYQSFSFSSSSLLVPQPPVQSVKNLSTEPSGGQHEVPGSQPSPPSLLPTQPGSHRAGGGIHASLGSVWWSIKCAMLRCTMVTLTSYISAECLTWWRQEAKTAWLLFVFLRQKA